MRSDRRRTKCNLLWSVLTLLTMSAVTHIALGKEEAEKKKLPGVGEKATDFTLQALDDQSVTLSELTKDSPVVLVVLRGYPGYQCPLCTAQVGSLIGKAKQLADADAKVVLVYPGPGENVVEKAQEFIKFAKLPENFVFVTDPDYKFTEAYALRWDAPRETAYPSTFVIDRNGIIRFAKISKSHGGRANPADVLEALIDAG